MAVELVASMHAHPEAFKPSALYQGFGLRLLGFRAQGFRVFRL